jgi:DNA-binding NtrC family response regulator
LNTRSHLVRVLKALLVEFIMPAEIIPSRRDSGPGRPGAADEPTAAGDYSPAGRVLIVDDEPLVRWALAETLRPRGYVIEEAADAEAAVRAVGRGTPPDVVLLDLRLPGCSDLTLLRALRRSAPRAAIILMTAFGTPEMRDEATRLGAFRVVDKPFEMGSLAGLVSSALAS